jgi:hypothetical protein
MAETAESIATLSSEELTVSADAEKPKPVTVCVAS